MIFLKFLSKKLSINLQYIERCYIRREEIKPTYSLKGKFILIDRLKLIIRTVILPLSKIRIKKIDNYDVNIAYFDVFSNEDILKTRTFFVKYYDKSSVLVDNISFNNQKYFHLEMKTCLHFFKLYIFFVAISLYSLCDRTKFKYNILSNLFFNIIYYEMNKDKYINLKKIYIFNSYDFSSYLLAKYLEMNSTTETFFVIGNGDIDIHYKYDNSKNLNITFTSKIQYYQALALNEIGFFKNNLNKYLVYGDEKIIDTFNLDTRIKYDIAFFSSGFWARDKNSTWWDYDNIEEYDAEKNLYSKLEHNMICFLTKLAQENNIKFVIKTHPRDKYIVREKNMRHPFERFVDNKNIFLETPKNGNLSSNFLDSKIGITVFSSIFYQRCSYDLPMYFFNSDDSRYLYQINLKYLKEFEQFKYTSIEDLKNKLSKVL